MLLALAACGEPKELEFRVRFETTRGSAVRVEIRIQQGACGGPGDVLYQSDVRPPEAASSMEPPELEPGSYAFEATAYDATCRIVGEGCTTVLLPSDVPAIVAIRTRDADPLCPESECVDGACRDELDAAVDSEADAGSDAATPDADMPDGCAAEQCNYADDDCDGRVDEGFSTLSDPDNCGACGTVCTGEHTDRRCELGACVVSGCDRGFRDCDEDGRNGCETDITSAAHCGNCDRVCISGAPLCASSACVAACPSTTTQCGTDCANPVDPDHCMGCGIACPARAHAVRTCSAGVCGLTCSPGFGDCNGVESDGCETELPRYGLDDDGDGYGDAESTRRACEMPSGYVGNVLDCDDRNRMIAPDAAETCNVVDDDCDGHVDEGLYRAINTITTASPASASLVYVDYDDGPFVVWANDSTATIAPLDRTTFEVGTRISGPKPDDVRVVATDSGTIGVVRRLGTTLTGESASSVEAIGSFTSLTGIGVTTVFDATQGESNEIEVYSGDGTSFYRTLVQRDEGAPVDMLGVPGLRSVRRLAVANAGSLLRIFFYEERVDTSSTLEVRTLFNLAALGPPLTLLSPGESFAPLREGEALFVEPIAGIHALLYGVSTTSDDRVRARLIRATATGVVDLGTRDLMLDARLDTATGSGDEVAIVAGGLFQRFDVSGLRIPPAIDAPIAPGNLAYDPNDGRYYHAYLASDDDARVTAYGCR